MQRNPGKTASKVAVGVFLPIAATTAWNMSDPDRRKIYEDIDESEKANNIILIPDGVTQDAKGRWGVIKIPVPPGLSNLGSMVRRPMEQAAGLDPVKFSEMANNLIAAGTGQSVDVADPIKTAMNYLPQGLKPVAESYTNTNLFTGRKIVPESLAELPKSEQAKPYTSGTARLIGKALNESPLKVENFVRSSAAGVGGQLLNASDTVLNKLGAIPDEQVGGEDIGQKLQRRFSQARGGAVDERRYQEIEKYEEQGAAETKQEKLVAEKIVAIYRDPDVSPEEKSALLSRIKNRRIIDRVKTGLRQPDVELEPSDKLLRSLNTSQRARFIKDQLAGKTREEKVAIWTDFKSKGFITGQVMYEMKQLAAQNF
jgi:hypothetical protein